MAWSWYLIPITCESRKLFRLSFDLPSILNKVSTILSHIFFFNTHYIQFLMQNKGFPIWQLEKNVLFFPIRLKFSMFFFFSDILFFDVFPKVICSIPKFFWCYSMFIISIKRPLIMLKSMISWQKSTMTYVT